MLIFYLGRLRKKCDNGVVDFRKPRVAISEKALDIGYSGKLKIKG